MQASLDIVICTYNREELLLSCLDSLRLQSSEDFIIYVVNNYYLPFDDNVKTQLLSVPRLKLIHHPKPGLSEARNVGISNSSSPLVAFLDDDAKVGSAYVSDIISISASEPWACFGGGINSWWKYGRPRWLDETFGAKPKLSDHRQALKGGYNWGSNIIIRRDALSTVKGFPTYIGMKAGHIGYAAENIVQINLRKAGYIIGYDPELTIDHVVAKHKLQLGWHVKSSYATGRDGKNVFPDQYKVVGMIKTAKSCVVKPLKGIIRLIMDSSYYPENLFLDMLQPWALLIGKMKAIIYSSSADA